MNTLDDVAKLLESAPPGGCTVFRRGIEALQRTFAIFPDRRKGRNTQYKLVDGVKKVVSGYAGGHVENPTYEQVCEKTTGHAEVVQIEFDPAKITYRKIIDLFWDAHDPTTLNQQGADKGPQYRSIILYTSDAQKKSAEESKAAAQKNFPNPIVTEIVPLKKFYPAEDYHQDFAKNNPYQGYVRVVVTPKVEKFKKTLEKEAPKGSEGKK